jgi:outer membrane protein assembly factor BamA
LLNYLAMRSVFLIIFLLFSNFFSFSKSGDFIVLSDILIYGNEKTKSSIIVRELDFKKGDTIFVDDLEQKLNLNRNKIVNLQLFLKVDITIVICEAPFAEIQINLAEQFYIFPLPVFRLADRSFNEWWYNRGHKLNRTIYGVNLVHLNVGGRAEELIVNLENGFTRQLALIYRKPYIDKVMKTGLEFDLIYNTNKQISYKTFEDKLVFVKSDENVLLKKFSTRITLVKRNSFYERQRFELRYTKESVSDSISGLNPNYFLKSRTSINYFKLSYIFESDHRNNIVYPNQGFYFKGRISRTGILKNDLASQNEIYFVFSQYLPLSKTWFADFNIRSKITNPSLQAFSISQAFGYKNENVRGYDLNVIDGQKMILFKSNLRKLFIDRFFKLPAIGAWKAGQTQPIALYGRAFFDSGYVRNKFANLNSSLLANKLISGYGLGFDIVSSYSGALRVSYSINNQGGKGLFFDFGKEF